MREAEKRSEVAVNKKNTTSEGKKNYEQQKKQKSLQNKLSKIESKINKLEREINAIDVELQINYDETISQPNFFDNYQQKKNDLDVLMQEWEELTQMLE